MDLVKVIRKVQSKKADREKNQAVCFLCGRRTALLTVQQAAEYCKATGDEILYSAEQGAIHRIHNSRGEIRICQISLRQIENQFRDTLPLHLDLLKTLEMF
jgi:DNA-binding LytR/AlgR family response regulator